MQIEISPITEDMLLDESSAFGKTTLLQKDDTLFCYLGLGKKSLALEDIRLLGGFAWKKLSVTGDNEVRADFSPIAKRASAYTKEQVVSCFMEGWHMAAYQFTAYKKESKPLPMLHLISEEETFSACDKLARHKADAVHFARDLCNAPANQLTPAMYADSLKEAFAQTDVSVKIIEDDALSLSEFPAMHAVAKGSSNAPKLAVLTLNRDDRQEKVALVGKGVTFDSGGINAKTGRDIGDMKMDMGGSAAVAGAMKLLEASGSNVNVTAVLPLVQNISDGNAMLPSDVIKYRNGLHVEVGNTDAEGRLVLADGMLYAQEELGAKKIVDIATLTGSIGRALGTKAAGIFSNDEVALWDYKQLGDASGDYVWPMPIYEEYMEHLHTDVADVNNMSNSPLGGSIAAALFLKQFTEKAEKWVHIDMANKMTPQKVHSYYTPGASGYGVRLLYEMVLEEISE